MRFVPVSGIHLTLKFLGEILPGLADSLHPALDRVAGARLPFTVRVRGAGCFPDHGRPRVLWVGLEESQGALASVQRAIELECAGLGLPAEDRPFSPHLTLGRVRHEAGAEAASFVRAVLDREQAVELGVLTVDSVHLFRSDLRPTGAEHHRLHSSVLGAGQCMRTRGDA
jgi:2'-5' RNA ligase